MRRFRPVRAHRPGAVRLRRRRNDPGARRRGDRRKAAERLRRRRQLPCRRHPHGSRLTSARLAPNTAMPSFRRRPESHCPAITSARDAGYRATSPRTQHEDHRRGDSSLRVRVVATRRRREHPERHAPPRRSGGVHPYRRGRRRGRHRQPARPCRHPDPLDGDHRRGSAATPRPVGADDPRLVQAGQRGGRGDRHRRHRQRPVGPARQDRRRPAVAVLRSAGNPACLSTPAASTVR